MTDLLAAEIDRDRTECKLASAKAALMGNRRVESDTDLLAGAQS